MALSLCLYEALDNVFEHSQASTGFLMAQTGLPQMMSTRVA